VHTPQRADLLRLRRLRALQTAAITLRWRPRPALEPLPQVRATALAAYRRTQTAARAWLVDDAGVVAPVAALLLLMLLGFCALVLDVGLVYAQRRALQNAADAAALAAARELQLALLGASGDPAGLAASFAGQNGVPAEAGDCTRSDTSTLVANRAGALPHSWEVETSRVVPLVFGRAVGVPALCVRARALAVVVELRTTKIWPWAVLSSEAHAPGDTIVLKAGAQGGQTGNRGIVAFDGLRGAKAYCERVNEPYGTRPGDAIPERIPPGTWVIEVEPGNEVSCNAEIDALMRAHAGAPCAFGEADIRCPLVGMVPVLRETQWPNGRKAVTVVDFAVIRLEEVTDERGQGHNQVLGRFLQYAGGVGPTRTPDPDGELRGLIGVRLWE
jgi:hypothetical protein